MPLSGWSDKDIAAYGHGEGLARLAARRAAKGERMVRYSDIKIIDPASNETIDVMLITEGPTAISLTWSNPLDFPQMPDVLRMITGMSTTDFYVSVAQAIADACRDGKDPLASLANHNKEHLTFSPPRPQP